MIELLFLISFYLVNPLLAHKVTCETEFSMLNHSISEVICPSNCLKQNPALCGRGVYPDGPVCLAAIQEELIDDSGGFIRVFRTFEKGSFASSSQNGVASQACKPSESTAFTFEMTCSTTGNTQHTITKVICPPGCQGQVYSCGNNAFHLNSSICSAAINAGKITASGGEVTVFKYTEESNIFIGRNGKKEKSCNALSWFTLSDVDACAYGNPCLNGGTCVDLLGDFGCICPSAYTGKRCETGLRCPSSNLTFPRDLQIEDYALYRGEVPSFSAATMCMWINLFTLSHSQTFVSYAVPGSLDNILVIVNFVKIYPLLVMVAQKSYRFSADMESNKNYHLCIGFDTAHNSTRVYFNGTQSEVKETMYKPTTAGGYLVLGQDQDGRNITGFDRNQAFYGTITNFAMWPRVLTSSEIDVIYRTCNCPQDYVIPVTQEQFTLKGNVTNDVYDVCPIG